MESNPAFEIIDYILKKYSDDVLPANPNTYQTWWGLCSALWKDGFSVGRCFVHEKKNEKGETEYHRIDPIKVHIVENKETKITTCEWDGYKASDSEILDSNTLNQGE